MIKVMGVDKYIVGEYSKSEGGIVEVIKSFDLTQLEQAKRFLRNLRKKYDNNFRLAREYWQGVGSTDYEFIIVRGGKK
jgi:hypothetical protein